MTVNELLIALYGLPPDADVWLSVDNRDGSAPLTKIEVQSAGKMVNLSDDE